MMQRGGKRCRFVNGHVGWLGFCDPFICRIGYVYVDYGPPSLNTAESCDATQSVALVRWEGVLRDGDVHEDDADGKRMNGDKKGTAGGGLFADHCIPYRAGNGGQHLVPQNSH